MQLINLVLCVCVFVYVSACWEVSTLSQDTGSLSDLILTDLARLADQQAPGIFLYLSPQYWDIQTCAFLMGSWD